MLKTAYYRTLNMQNHIIKTDKMFEQKPHLLHKHYTSNKGGYIQQIFYTTMHIHTKLYFN